MAVSVVVGEVTIRVLVVIVVEVVKQELGGSAIDVVVAVTLQNGINYNTICCS